MDSSLSELIAQGEGPTVEFKTSFQKEVIETVVAFANAKGGKVFIGINDSGGVVGTAFKKETLQDWINQIKINTQPSILVDIETVETEGKEIAVVDVKEYPIKPIAYKSRYYKRIKNSNHLMGLDEIANMHLQTINASWDYHIDERHDFSDISEENINYFIKKVEQNLNKKFTEDPLMILRKYELIKKDKLTFGAYLLFTSNNSAITAFQIGRFKDPITIIDNIDINTNILLQVERAIEFIKKHLMTEFIITGEPQRTVKYDYPLEAIREIVINMVVHRDYRDSGNSIIKIFDDKIEFFNPGKLYDNLTIKELLSGDYSSRARNRAIARSFKEAGIIERYGSGIKRIQDECRGHGVIDPLFEEFAHGFRVTMFKEKLKTTQETTQEATQEATQETKKLSTREKIIRELKKDATLTRDELSQKIGVSANAIKQHLSKLKSDSLIKRIGSTKSGYWEVLDAK